MKTHTLVRGLSSSRCSRDRHAGERVKEEGLENYAEAIP